MCCESTHDSTCCYAKIDHDFFLNAQNSRCPVDETLCVILTWKSARRHSGRWTMFIVENNVWGGVSHSLWGFFMSGESGPHSLTQALSGSGSVRESGTDYLAEC